MTGLLEIVVGDVLEEPARIPHVDRVVTHRLHRGVAHDLAEDVVLNVVVLEPLEQGAFLGAGGMFLGLTTLLLLGRWIWKRFIRDDTPAPRILPPADSERLKRLENGVEAMAVEIERISEGQRYVTKLLSESRGVESAR